MKNLASSRHAALALAALLPLLAGSSAAQAPQKAPAPTPQEPAPFKNLQVFPKDIGHDELIATMRSWARGTGMSCDDCHAEDAKTHEHDYASDELEHKKIARQMYRMVLAINQQYIGALPAHHGEGHQTVTCYSCHRGQEEPPIDLASQVTGLVKEKGTAAGLARYQELRKDHLVDGRYDFSERSLLIVAANLADAKRLDDAITILRANLDLYPNVSNVHLALGRLLAEKGDRAGAEGSLKKALELDPKNERAKRALAALSATPEKPRP